MDCALAHVCVFLCRFQLLFNTLGHPQNELEIKSEMNAWNGRGGEGGGGLNKNCDRKEYVNNTQIGKYGIERDLDSNAILLNIKPPSNG